MRTVFSSFALFLFCCSSFAQSWDISSLFDDYKTEGWYIYSAPRAGTEITQNSDGTVSIARLGADSQTVYLTHDVSWIEPPDGTAEFWYFTYEFRLRVDQIGGPNSGAADEHGDRSSIYPLKNRPDGVVDTYSNGRTWLCSFDKNYIGSRYFANALLPIYELDLSQFHVLTFVCKFDYVLYDEKVLLAPDINYGEAFEGDAYPDRALGDHSPWTLYVDRNFVEPALTDMPGSGWNGWGSPAVDADGIMQIGFQGNTRGKITLDYFRTGNGIILDPNEPVRTGVLSWRLWEIFE
ncbi:MAG: hypothetical protein AB1656_23880 [Candidatus Omnitrophota bacterium]